MVAVTLDLAAFSEEVTRAWWPKARARTIDLGFESTVVTVVAHPGLLKQALGNLLHNAMRYTPAGGTVTVRISVQGDKARLSVIDDGPGIPEPERHRAGERFFRGSNTSQAGSGLGLAIVRSIAERHGGSMAVDSGVNGCGLAVSMLLPLALGQPLAKG